MFESSKTFYYQKVQFSNVFMPTESYPNFYCSKFTTNNNFVSVFSEMSFFEENMAKYRK